MLNGYFERACITFFLCNRDIIIVFSTAESGVSVSLSVLRNKGLLRIDSVHTVLQKFRWINAHEWGRKCGDCPLKISPGGMECVAICSLLAEQMISIYFALSMSWVERSLSWISLTFSSNSIIFRIDQCTHIENQTKCMPKKRVCSIRIFYIVTNLTS